MLLCMKGMVRMVGRREGLERCGSLIPCHFQGSKLDTELTRIHDHCHQVHSSLKLSSNFGQSIATPSNLYCP